MLGTKKENEVEGERENRTRKGEKKRVKKRDGAQGRENKEKKKVAKKW